MNLHKVSQILGVIMVTAMLSPAALAVAPDSASAEKQRQAHQQKATTYREMRQQMLATNELQGLSAEERRRQSLKQQVAIRKGVQRQTAAEKDAARRAEASRLVMERNAKN